MAVLRLFVLVGIISGSILLTAAEKSRPDFQPPTAKEQMQAIGPVAHLSPTLRLAFSTKGFAPIPAPAPNDWLGQHVEPGQTLAEFLASRPNRPVAPRTILYLQPLGEFDPERTPSLDALRDLSTAFFGLETRVLPPQPLDAPTLRHRTRSSGREQFVSNDILTHLRDRLPDDAFCMLGVTMFDLYAMVDGKAWNFVFGQASLRDRTGVFSFARYDPAFTGGELTVDARRLMFRRAAQVLLHETCHMFGLQHCVHFHCVVNGSNHLAESDSQPLHLCPVCLRKLHSSASFDVVARYERLEKLFRQYGLDAEADWIREQLTQLRPTGITPR
jgi:archaemetzincin